MSDVKGAWAPTSRASRRGAWALGVTLWGCTHTAPTDEARVRAELQIPAGSALVRLDARPLHGGTFGREGLRILAVFRVPDGAAEPWMQGRDVRALPLPQNVWAFRDPPEELRPIGGNAKVWCEVISLGGTTPAGRFWCAEAPARFDRYRVAVYRPETHELWVVLKNYY